MENWVKWELLETPLFCASRIFAQIKKIYCVGIGFILVTECLVPP